MTRVELTNELLGDLGELYFRHLCVHRAYGYTRLENVHKTLPNRILEFKFGYERIPIMIPSSLVGEVTRVSKPIIINGNRSFVFDFLTCRVYKKDSTKRPNVREPGDFCWVEIKTGKSNLSNHQLQIAQTCGMRFAVFRIRNVTSSPREVEIDWEYDSLNKPKLHVQSASPPRS